VITDFKVIHHDIIYINLKDFSGEIKASILKKLFTEEDTKDQDNSKIISPINFEKGMKIFLKINTILVLKNIGVYLPDEDDFSLIFINPNNIE